jgi:translation initiation factor IF-3
VCGIIRTLILWKIPEEENPISASNYRVNQFIRVKEVRLIGPNNENVGVVPIEEARRISQEADLDLVEVAPNSEPPVCRVMDFGKFLYERTKKEREARKAQTKIEVKEIRLRPKTTTHHRSFKVRDARGWLEDGMKVIVRIRFKGREIDYVDLGLQDLKEVAEELMDVAVIEKPPVMEGRSVLMVLAPTKPVSKKKSQTQPETNA